MRRLLAVLLLAVFNFAWIAPAIPVDAEAQLPACCRTKGKHKCVMLQSLGANAVPVGLSFAAKTCPYSCSKGSLAPAFQKSCGAVFLSFSRFVTVSLLAPPTVVRNASTAFSHNHSQRGPPFSLA